MTLLLAGYLVIQLFEHTIAPHFHFGAETHPESFMKPAAAYTAVGGLFIHFFDGVSIAAAFLVSFRVGLLVFVAILLHKMPEGFTVASIMLASGRSHRKALLATAAIGAATLAGVVSVALLQARVHSAIAYALPFSAGVTLYVAASDLIPEVNHNEHRNPTVSIVVFVGVALFYLLHKVIGGKVVANLESHLLKMSSRPGLSLPFRAAPLLIALAIMHLLGAVVPFGKVLAQTPPQSPIPLPSFQSDRGLRGRYRRRHAEKTRVDLSEPERAR